MVARSSNLLLAHGASRVTEIGRQKLEFGVHELGLVVGTDKIDLLLYYIKLLLKWNKVYSLTAITDFEQAITLHLLDGLTVIPHLGDARHIIDVGSGMGVPGIVIAICYPDIQVCALDSNHKKTAFLQQVAIELGLTNLQVICCKVEEYKPKHLYDLAISRAFSSSQMFINLTGHLLLDSGVWLLMKSKRVEAELDKISSYNYNLIPLRIPGCIDERYLLKIK